MKIRSIAALAAIAFGAQVSADNPQFTQALVPSDGATNDYLVGGAIHGDTVVLGAPDDDVNAGNMNDGSAYVFRRAVAGGWSQLQKLTRPDVTSGAQFGAQVRLTSDGLLFVSAERNQLYRVQFLRQVEVGIHAASPRRMRRCAAGVR